MYRQFGPSTAARMAQAALNYTSAENAGAPMDPQQIQDGRRAEYKTEAEDLLSQAAHLLNRELNETDRKYFVDYQGNTWYMNGEEKKLVPEWSRPPRTPILHTALETIDEAARQSAHGGLGGFPTRKEFAGNNRAMTNRIVDIRRR